MMPDARSRRLRTLGTCQNHEPCGVVVVERRALFCASEARTGRCPVDEGLNILNRSFKGSKSKLREEKGDRDKEVYS